MQARACQDNAHHRGKPILGQFSGTSPPCTIAPSHLRPTGLCIIIGWSTQTIVASYLETEREREEVEKREKKFEPSNRRTVKNATSHDTTDASGLPPRQIDLFTGPNIHHDAYPEIHPRHSPHAGKSVLITGASQGLGRAIAIGYARAGATRIALAARTDLTTTADLLLAAAEEESHPAPEVLALDMDVADAASVRAAAARLDDAWAGRLDILVCNAGYMASFAQLLEADEEDLMRTFDVNYWGTYRCCRAFVPIMISGGGDRTVVTLTSIAAHFIGGGSGAYSLSKFALVRLTEFLQDEYASQTDLPGRAGVFGPPRGRVNGLVGQAAREVQVNTRAHRPLTALPDEPEA
ncbi:conserved hypothetical protein [Verticillium alfalfae VaMs.102]|uniref:NAD(P)-binding protein n=1 Tax=Verticillium alfalfae (strain VaMs.102 / ATCC MYA-4576 / FGSC 10136) TaxID=526221 RepID=C9SQS6_VERA1|nr:conserved hypothetical protein [Verticillium alfalfae VaMs.102]EEY21201.1 conserved hypothetical protein [Verticillium alfalfae VaMs.102]